MRDDFAVFILTYKRPNKVKTLKTLSDCGYTGKIYLIVDNTDDTVQEYVDNFGDSVIVFDKEEMWRKADNADNFKKLSTITHARNASFEIAEKLGIKYFIQLDDDYLNFRYRYDNNYLFCNSSKILSLDKVFSAMLRFYENIPALSIALAQTGDFLGGSSSGYSKKIDTKRKCMNSFICSTDRKFMFRGTMNEDVNTYTLLGSRGNIFLTIMQVMLDQTVTQSNSGGITELYKDAGTYVKAFYTVMHMPSSVKISEMRSRNKRIHHMIDWRKTAPKIISEKHKKQGC